MENLTNFLNYYPEGVVMVMVLSSFLLSTMLAWGVYELINLASKEYKAIRDGFLKLESFNLRTRTGLELAQKAFSKMPFKIKKGVSKKWYKKYHAHFMPYLKVMNDSMLTSTRLKKYTWLISMEDDLANNLEAITKESNEIKPELSIPKVKVGRPKGSKNKPKTKVGRPKGSKNKPKTKVGRPKGSKKTK